MEQFEFQIGDEFRIDHMSIYKLFRTPNKYRCRYPDKTFIVKRLSHSKLSVYYDDKRTSKKCLCDKCSKKGPEKCVDIKSIIFVCSKLQRDRAAKLKKLVKD